TSFRTSRPATKISLIPYTTLFRSLWEAGVRRHRVPLAVDLEDRADPGCRGSSGGDGRGGRAGGRNGRFGHPPASAVGDDRDLPRSEEHTSELQSRFDLVCRLLLEK